MTTLGQEEKQTHWRDTHLAVPAAILALLVLPMIAGAKSKPDMMPPPPREAVAAGVTARLETDNPLSVVRLGQEAKARFTIANSSSAPAKARLELDVESYDGAKTARTADLDVPAKSTIEWALPKETLGSLGHKTVRFLLRVGDEASSQAERMLAYMTPSGRLKDRGPGTLFGLAFGAGPDNSKDESALAADWLGLDVVRLHPSWNAVEPKAGAWSWEKTDEMLRRFESHGIKIQILFSGTPAWAVKNQQAAKEARNRGEKTESYCPDPRAWETFAGQFAARYKGRVSYYEIWNEPDITFWTGTEDEYLDLLRGACRAIRTSDPKAVVMTGGFAGGGQEFKLKAKLVERTLAEARDSFDIIAYHRHGFFKDFTQEIEGKLLPLREKTGCAAKPIYFTETAMDARKGYAHQAETLIKKISYSCSLGAVAYTWFNLHNGSNAPRQMGWTYGLLTRDGEPKPNFVAYNTLTGLLRGKTPSPRLQAPPDVWALPFRAGNEWVVVCWLEDSAASGKLPEQGPPSATLRIHTDAQTAEIVDLMGNTRPLPVSSGAISPPLSSAPIFVRLTGANKGLNAARLVGIE